jgi:hypothetical protein
MMQNLTRIKTILRICRIFLWFLNYPDHPFHPCCFLAERVAQHYTRQGTLGALKKAERVGFEPTVPCGTRALQARALGRTMQPLHFRGFYFSTSAKIITCYFITKIIVYLVSV